MDHSLVESTIQDQCTYITNTVSSFTESVQQMSDKLQLHNDDVGHFLAAELKQDVPTGSLSFVACLCWLISKMGHLTQSQYSSIFLFVPCDAMQARPMPSCNVCMCVCV